jgi:hypothetical protein
MVKALLIGTALVFTISVWLYAYTLPTIPRSVEKVLSLVCVVSCLLLAALSAIIALAHI